MEQKRIDRISELTRKSRTPEGLTDAEQQERAALRQEYIRAMVGDLDRQLQHTVLVRPDGSREKLQKKEDGKR